MKIKDILQEINKLALRIKKTVRLMEVCGTHTQVIVQNGIRQLMPKNIKLLTGPGCPVCITPEEDVDKVLALALNNIPIATYGDALFLKGSTISLKEAQEKGAKIFPVYSIEEAVGIKKKYPNLVFWGIGFETTAPMSAWAIKNKMIVFPSHKLFVPALKFLIRNKELNVDGFILPGHVSTITGILPYQNIRKPGVISGFEVEDIIQSIYLLLKQINNRENKIENEYHRTVKKEGNIKALKLIFDIFEIKDSFWRGLGKIPQSGLKIKSHFAEFDAEKKYQKIMARVKKNNSKKNLCLCNLILRGIKSPKNCRLFKKLCTPERPYGPCMVSREGACNVEYRYNF